MVLLMLTGGDYQMLLTVLVIALAVFLLARRVYRLLRGRGGGGCHGCNGCGKDRKKKDCS